VVAVTDFLLELRSEEIPARMQVKAKDDLARLFAEEIAKAGLTAQSLETFATPRRLALIARGLPDQTESVSEERKGPRASAPEQALAGFLRSTGLTREQLTERDGVLFAVIDKPGRPTADVLAKAIPAIIRAFPWPKSMRWGDASISTESLRWVRPLQGIVALFGEDIVACEVDGIVSVAATMGHRFHHSGPVKITSAATYVEDLRATYVIVHLSERRKLIEDGAAKAAAATGLSVIPDEGLVLENAGLTEWPVPLLGRFDPAFLDVPREVIQLTMRTNQKYFACADAEGKLANAFVCTANLSPSDGGAAVIAGNEKVLSARLSDAKFFWEQDLKVPLEEQTSKLKDIVFHEKLGTVADKVDRVAKLARWLVETGVVTQTVEIVVDNAGAIAVDGKQTDLEHLEADLKSHSRHSSAEPTLADLAETVARLCKADLVTGMVGEFPELQGIMGGYYARAQGYPDAVADAIRDHYKPVGQGDDVPTAPVTVAVSLADKLDSVMSFFLADMRPTGSSDPFALRRAALGICSLILRNRLAIRLNLALTNPAAMLAGQGVGNVLAERQTRALDALREGGFEQFVEPLRVQSAATVLETAHGPTADDIMLKVFGKISDATEFIIDRLKVQQREAGVRHDLIDAVFALGGEDDLVRLLARVKALQSFVTTHEGANLLSGYKRASSILKKANYQVEFGKHNQTEGKGGQHYLSAALDRIEPIVTSAVQSEDFVGAMTALAQLRTPIDDFFEAVLVNDPDVDKARANLALLYRFRDAVHTIADFSKIEG
jgi:glycyl-tRNA synthetase beta chain